MKSTILILLSLLANLSFSQIETENYKTERKKFIKNYNNDDVLDGTQWELTIKREGRRKRRIFGSNAYPEPKGTFNSFIKALNKLSKSEIEFEEEDF